jgi:Family of unknown function (DUF6152)
VPKISHTVLASVALVLATTRANAHHAFASEYDATKLVTVSGTVTGFEWTNPHAWLYVEGKDDGGKIVSWSFEMGAPGGLVRRGWKRSDVKKGDQITIDGFSAKDGTRKANARIVVLPDGRKLFGGFGSTPRAPVK